MELLQKLEENDLFISIRSLELDIEVMRYERNLGYHAPIGYCTKNRGYHYTDPAYSINRIHLSNEELGTLLVAIDLIKPYKNISSLRNFQSIVSKVIEHVNKQLPGKPLIPEIECICSFQDSITDLINRFIQAIRDGVVVKVCMNEMSLDREKEFFFHAYSVATDQEHWYVTGLRDTDQIHIFLQLECIDNILFSDKTFIPFEYQK